MQDSEMISILLRKYGSSIYDDILIKAFLPSYFIFNIHCNDNKHEELFSVLELPKKT